MPPSDFWLGYAACRALLATRLAEPPPGRIQLLVGPRQVGKTTLLLDLEQQYAPSAIYAAADAPEASLAGFWDRLWARADDVAARDGRAIVLLDEAHLVPQWATRLKGEWDRLRRRRRPIHVVATGSSAMRLGSGSRESLAGRFERVTLSHWQAADVASRFGLSPADAAQMVVAFGAYPGAIPYRGQAARWTAYVRDAIVEPAVGRDILALGVVRKPALLRQVFSVCASSPAQIISLQKIQGQLADRGALETVAHYLSLLQEAFLIAALPKYATRAARARAAPPKIVALSNALLAVTDPRGSPDAGADPARFGAWVENACLAYACNAGQRVRYWREEPLEVDGVIDGTWGKWVIEVKTGDVTAASLRGLGEFARRHPDFRPLVVCDERARSSATRLGFDAVRWTDFLMRGPEGREI